MVKQQVQHQTNLLLVDFKHQKVQQLVNFVAMAMQPLIILLANYRINLLLVIEFNQIDHLFKFKVKVLVQKDHQRLVQEQLTQKDHHLKVFNLQKALFIEVMLRMPEVTQKYSVLKQNQTMIVQATWANFKFQIVHRQLARFLLINSKIDRPQVDLQLNFNHPISFMVINFDQIVMQHQIMMYYQILMLYQMMIKHQINQFKASFQIVQFTKAVLLALLYLYCPSSSITTFNVRGIVASLN